MDSRNDTRTALEIEGEGIAEQARQLLPIKGGYHISYLDLVLIGPVLQIGWTRIVRSIHTTL